MSNGSIARSMRANSASLARAARRLTRQLGARAKLGTESRVGVKQKPWRELRPAEPSCGFRVAGGGEIEQRQALEERRIGHGRVERRDQLFGRVQFVLRHLRVGAQRRLAFRSVRGVLQHVEQPCDPQERQRKAGRQQRVDHARCRRQQRPPRSAHLPAAKRQPWRVHERQHARARRETDRGPTAASPAGDPRPARRRRRETPRPPDRSAPRRRW